MSKRTHQIEIVNIMCNHYRYDVEVSRLSEEKKENAKADIPFIGEILYNLIDRTF